MGRAEQKADVLEKDQSPGDVKNEVSSRPEDAHSFRLLSAEDKHGFMPVSYTHLRAHET